MNKTAKSFTIVTGFSVLTRALAFIFKIWISRTLGAETVGLYQIALSVIMLLLTVTSGAPTVLSRKVAETADPKKQNSYATASLLLGLAVSICLCVPLYALKDRIGFLFADERCLPLFLIMLPTLLTTTAYASLRSWFWGRKKFLAFSSTELLDEVVKIILAIVFASGLVTHFTGASGIALAMTLSDALCVLVLAILYFISGGRFQRPTGFKELTLRTIPLSATRIITSLTASMSAIVIPQMLIKSGMTKSIATAAYGRVAGMALPLIMAPVMLISSLAVVLIPDIASLKAKGETEAVKNKISALTTFSLLIAGAFYTLYLPLGRQIGTLLFKDAEAGAIVERCSAMLFPISIAQAVTPTLNSLGKERATFLISLLGALVTIPCTFLLPKFVGVYALAIGSTLCFSIIAISGLIILRKQIGPFMDLKKCIKILAFSLPLALLGHFVSRLLQSAAGNIVSTLVTATLIIFFLVTFTAAFKIVDIWGYLKLLRPAKFSLKKKSKPAKDKNNISRKKTHYPRENTLKRNKTQK